MKLRGTGVRFVMVSATVPNIEDIAAWIESAYCDRQPAKVFRVSVNMKNQ
jgi:ATP-dependent DNA helicase HFM1/MER3